MLYEHCKEDHDNRIMKDEDFAMDVTGRYRSSLLRQTAEGVLIDEKMKRSRNNNLNVKLLNSQSQFHQPKLIKPRPSNIKYKD